MSVGVCECVNVYAPQLCMGVCDMCVGCTILGSSFHFIIPKTFMTTCITSGIQAMFRLTELNSSSGMTD